MFETDPPPYNLEKNLYEIHYLMVQNFYIHFSD